jgi:enamine deaminase RidA (YjgF/YER057c/UK114 family)
MKFTRDDSGTPWERTFGYARAVRASGLVLVSGTVAADRDGRPLADDAYGQAREALRLIERSLVRLGSRLDHVLRLRVYYVDPAVGGEFARAFAEAFGTARPALTTVRVAGLTAPEFLLEIEADAIAVAWEPDPTAPKAPAWDEPVD